MLTLVLEVFKKACQIATIRMLQNVIAVSSVDKIPDLAEKVGIEGVSPHSFRRTALTQMSDAGVPLRHIQAISGHRTLAALERYLGVTDKQKQHAISTLDF